MIGPGFPGYGVLSALSEPSRFRIQGWSMADKSPRNSMSKKSGKSLKEKRADKKMKTNGQSDPEIVTHVKKR